MRPCSVAGADLAAGRLKAILEAYPQGETSIYAVFAHRRHQPAKVRAFVDFLATRLRDEPWRTNVPRPPRDT